MAIILGTINNDLLNGGNGKDSIFGDLGDDRLFGRNGKDELRGGDGDDYLDGGNGNDMLNGGLGNDVFNGGRGADRLTTGDGEDTIWVQRSGGGVDVVTDFDPAFDSIAAGVDVSLRHARVGDWNGDGTDDLVLQFSRGGSLVLLGISDTPVIDHFLG